MDAPQAIVSNTNTHIVDSYLIRSKKAMQEYLQSLRDGSSPEMSVHVRNIASQVREWRAHNFFYFLHVFRSRTKDVDLELKQPWYRELFCAVVSFFYFW